MKKVKSVASRRAFSRKPPEKEVVWPERFEAKAVPRQRRRWGPIILAVSGLIILVCLSLLGLAYGYASAFAREAGVPLMTLVQSVYQGWQEDVWGIDNQVTFLVLGLDAVVNQRDNSQLTDTIMLVIAQRDGTIRLISLPRDLWLAALKTKINALYYYGEKDKLGQGKDFTRTWVTQITGIPIDEIVILKMDWVKTAIDAVGGISVPIETGFSDSQYPRDEADLTSTDPAVLYKAVVFNPGIENMNGARALEYMR